MTSVRRWAEGAGWDYLCLDDTFFSLAPDWTRQLCQGNLYAVTDIARLVWARKMLEAGYDRVVWADADLLVFAPQALSRALTGISGHGFSRELFLRMENDGHIKPLHGLNNALMLFDRGDATLDGYLAACYAQLHALAQGPVPRTALGPAILRQIATTTPLNLIDGVGLFSPLIMREIAIDGGRLTREYLRHCTTFPAAANLCHFMRNATPPRRRAAFDQLYDHAVVRLLESAGQVLNGTSA